MKKLLFLILISFVQIVYSYENDFFLLDVNDEYKETIKDNVYSWSKDNIFINVVINKNKNNYDINKFNDKDLEKQKTYIIDSYKDELSTYNIIPVINNMYVNKEGSISYLEYDLKFDSSDIIGHNIYQKCRLYTSNNYVYLLTYNSEEEINEEDIKVMNSFQIKDTYLKNVNYTIYVILFILFGGLILLADYLINKKRHK